MQAAIAERMEDLETRLSSLRDFKTGSETCPRELTWAGA